MVAEASHEGPASWLGFTPDGLALISVRAPATPDLISSGAGDGFRSILLDDVVAAAVHPSGASLVAASVLHRLLVVDARLARVDRHFPVSFGSEAVGRHFNAPEMAVASRRQMNDLRKLLKKSGVPPGFNSLEEFMARIESGYAEDLRKTQEQAAATFAAGGIFRMRFDQAGERLYLATTAGLRAYSWLELKNAGATLPHPIVALDAVGRPQDRRYGTGHFSDFIYDLAFDADRGRLLFAGKAGRVSFLEVASGRTGVLVETSERSPIQRMALSRNRDCDCARSPAGPAVSSHGERPRTPDLGLSGAQRGDNVKRRSSRVS